MTIELTFDVPPGVNNFYLNAPGKGRVVSEVGKAWREVAGWQIMLQKPRHIPGPVILDIAISDVGRADLDGKLKPAIDALVAYGVIEDDDRAIVRKIEAYWSSDVESCRVRITEANF